MTVDAVVNKINDTDDVDWDNSEDEEDWDVESNVEEVDPLDLAQITDPTEENSMDNSSITTMPVTNTPHTASPNALVLTQISDVPSSTATMPLTHTTTQPSITSTAATNTTSSPYSPPEFTQSVGPAVSLDSAATALDAFLLIFGDNTFKLLADQTNLYARQTPPGASYKWYDTNENEMKLFIGMLLAMGIHRLPQLEDYWSSHSLLGAKGIVSGMSWRRFRVLLSCLHIADNSCAIPRGQPGHDKLHKVRPLLDILQSNISKCYHPHREVAVDEAMVGFKGRSTLKQYMPMKPTKRGFKIWCLCDSTNGFTYRIEIYTGAGSTTPDVNGLGPSVVLNLAEPLLDRGHFLYFDNYFSSVDLASKLLKRNTYSVSTTRTNREGWPQQLKDTKHLNKTLTRGHHRSVVVDDGRVECMAWKDNKVVSMINTLSPPTSMTTVKRKGKDGQSSQIPCPESIKLYNKFMGGVDLADARRKTYSCSRRAKKWWHRLFYYLLDVAVVDAFILHAESPHCAKKTQKEFVLDLAEELMSSFNSRKRQANPLGDGLPAERFSQQHFPTKSKKCLQCRVCSTSSSRKRSLYQCTTCNPEDPVHLWVDPCFRIWHTKED